MMKNAPICDSRPSAPKACPYIRVHGTAARFGGIYRRALGDYLEQKAVKRVKSPHALGCLALRRGLGLFDLARLHEAAMAKVMMRGTSTAKTARQMRAAEIFLLDAISPYEAARRGLPEVYAKVGELNVELELRNKALIAETVRQRRMDDALRASEARYGLLLEQARSMKMDIRQHAAKMIRVQEEERKRVSRDLHDELGQALATVNLGLAILKKQASHDPSFQDRLTSFQALLERSMESVHLFARELRPETLDHFGPFEAIRMYVAEFAERTGITATLQSDVDLTGIDHEQAVVLFRVAQESITNISKHAHATRIDIRFFRLPEEIHMEIQDNGRAFSVEEKLGRSKGKRLGLLGMEERVRLVRGNFSIKSVAGRGTTVGVRFPVGSSHAAISPECETRTTCTREMAS